MGPKTLYIGIQTFVFPIKKLDLKTLIYFQTRLHKYLDPVWMVLSVIQQYQAERIFIFKWLFGTMNTLGRFIYILDSSNSSSFTF